MSISMSDAQVHDDHRQSFLSSNVNTEVIQGGEELNQTSSILGSNPTGKPLAGITSAFATNVVAKIDDYIEGINATLEKLNTADPEIGIKGGAVDVAIKHFVLAVKQEAKNYTDKLRVAETQIINSVSVAYGTQDSDLGANLQSDSSML